MRKFVFCILGCAALFAGVFMATVATAEKGVQELSVPAVSTTIVISQAYGGGGTTGTYMNDYVELKNISASPQSLSGLSLMYGSATGQFASSASNAFALANVSLLPGQYYLVQLSTAGMGGVALPVTPDEVTTNLSMSGTNGKVALTNGLTPNTCGATATPCTLPNAQIIDLVAWGTANNAEGGASTNGGAALTSVQGNVRKTAGCTETDNNNADFDVLTAPVPRNSATTAAPCGAVPTADAPFDYNGDAKTDISIFRPSNGQWWIQYSGTSNTFVATFGASADVLVPADYTGDGKDDIAFFRPSTGEWFILRSQDSSFYSFPFGGSGDIPVPGDFDNDNKDDAAIFRPSNQTWYTLNSGGGTTITTFGVSGDLPVAADYDGDGKADVGIFRPSNGQWWINRSQAGLIVYSFGVGTDKALPGDFTGDGKADVAFWRPSTGEWYVLRSENASFYSFPFGISTDLPVPGDYDGDGKIDAAVFRGSNVTWFINGSTAGSIIQSFGAAGDKPTPNAYVR